MVGEPSLLDTGDDDANRGVDSEVISVFGSLVLDFFEVTFHNSKRTN